MSRLIDADELKKTIADPLNSAYGVDCTKYTRKLIDDAPTVDLWKYPSKGEYPKKINLSKKMKKLYASLITEVERWHGISRLKTERGGLQLVD